MNNPFSAPSEIAPEPSLFAPHAQLVRRFFLYREIQFKRPEPYLFTYTGWWFRQKITIADQNVWFRVSWLSLLKRAEFRIPASVDPREPHGVMEINFGRTLSILRFRLWFDDELVFDEIN